VTPVEIMGRDNTPALLRKLQFRANAARAFRAPSILDTYPGVGTAPTIVSSPTRMAPIYVAVQTSGNPQLKPETAVSLSGGLNWSPLRPVSLIADYWYYNYKDRIQAQNPTDQLARHDMSIAMGGPGNPTVVIDPATNDVAAIRVHPINVSNASVTTSGIDFGLTLRFDGADLGGNETDWGSLSLGAQGTYTANYYLPRSEILRGSAVAAADCKGPRDTDPCDVAGKRNTPSGSGAPALPRLKANIPLVWTFLGHSLSAIGHYISGFDDESQPSAADTARTGGSPHIPAWFTFDLQYGYSIKDFIGKEAGFRVGVFNLLDSMPPTVFGAYAPYEGEVHDPRGRMYYAKLEAEF
jgi:iron complex outermembrane receptor protein